MTNWRSEPPDSPGLYQHQWTDARGALREQVLFVGWVDWSQPRGQGPERPRYASALRCCPPDEPLHADRLTPQEWGGQWLKVPE